MNSAIAIVGNAAPDVRSDCQVQLEVKTSGGIEVIIDSKVKSLYGESMHKQCNEMLDFFGIKDASLKLIDNGALPFVIAARIEAAVKLITNSKKEFLPEFLPASGYDSTKERLRITRLYLPGNTPKHMINAGIHQPDGVILDLEDSVSPDKKHEARYLVRNALRQIDFMGAERMVRINQLPLGLEDIPFIVPHNVHLILLPKCESGEQLHELEDAVEKLKKKMGISAPIWYMPIIESALGVENSFEIATAGENVVSLAIGLEDYTADLDVQRSKEGTESFYARSRIVNACKAVGVQPVDSVFSDILDMDGLLETCKKSKAMGFEGMGCIHPRQIKLIREGFAPCADEIEKAHKIVSAFEEARAKGMGVVVLGSKMIDPPVVRRAIKTLDLAKAMGLLTSSKG